MALQSIIDLCGDTTFSDHPVSELTYSGSAGSKKRAYMALSQHGNFQAQNRLYESATATASGRPVSVTVPLTVAPLFSGDFASSLYSQSIEIDALVRFQTERLQSEMNKLRRKHCRDLVSMVEEQASKRLRVKEMELASLTLRNRELEDQVRQRTAESQVWFNYATTTEEVVSSLKAKLDEVCHSLNACPVRDVQEGYGDSGGESSAVEDIESSSEADVGRRTCRVCRENKVCVLLLPCRHLCLCKDCETRIDTCPVCSSTRNASIQVVI